MILIVVNTVIRVLFRFIARVRATGLERVPDSGPLIIVTNHINFLEIPLIYLIMRPRTVRGLTKSETWDNPALRILANLWGAIPIRRGAVDRAAFSAAMDVLRRGGFVGIAPEGTRSRHGRLQQSSAGVVLLAARSGAPVLPVAHWGGERVFSSLRRLRRVIVRVRVGELLYVDPASATRRTLRDGELRRIMGELARLLPPTHRGHYA